MGIKTDPNFIDLKTFHAFDLGGGSLELLEFRDNMIVTARVFRSGRTLKSAFRGNHFLSTFNGSNFAVWQSLENLSELKETVIF